MRSGRFIYKDPGVSKSTTWTKPSLHESGNQAEEPWKPNCSWTSRQDSVSVVISGGIGEFLQDVEVRRKTILLCWESFLDLMWPWKEVLDTSWQTLLGTEMWDCIFIKGQTMRIIGESNRFYCSFITHRLLEIHQSSLDIRNIYVH